MADAMADYYVKGFNHANATWTLSAIAMLNGGGFRASIQKGLSNIICVSDTDQLTEDYVYVFFLNYKLSDNKTPCKLLLLQIVLLPLPLPLIPYTQHYKN
ncbi:hypothetical protein DPMN_073785 [Dreissena polymorpha]|uniref:Uncharacterized protein n=1 Tax=Dreissena polymorpha TaxID=45954 RepID=A0A9D4HDV0_DREPO|nr:hypothetical protein DPMN_073785 [Dreissena polymorpha]